MTEWTNSSYYSVWLSTWEMASTLGYGIALVGNCTMKHEEIKFNQIKKLSFLLKEIAFANLLGFWVGVLRFIFPHIYTCNLATNYNN